VEVLSIVGIIIVVLIAAWFILAFAMAVVGFVWLYLPAIIGVGLGGYLWSTGHDNWGAAIALLGIIIGIPWFFRKYAGD
jgi:hypothetical protein